MKYSQSFWKISYQQFHQKYIISCRLSGVKLQMARQKNFMFYAPLLL